MGRVGNRGDDRGGATTAASNPRYITISLSDRDLPSHASSARHDVAAGCSFCPPTGQRPPRRWRPRRRRSANCGGPRRRPPSFGSARVGLLGAARRLRLRGGAIGRLNACRSTAAPARPFRREFWGVRRERLRCSKKRSLSGIVLRGVMHRARMREAQTPSNANACEVTEGAATSVCRARTTLSGQRAPDAERGREESRWDLAAPSNGVA